MSFEIKNKNRGKKAIPKSVWLPTIISIYFIVMAVIFGSEMWATGQRLKFILIAISEVIVIILMVIFLRKRERL